MAHIYIDKEKIVSITGEGGNTLSIPSDILFPVPFPNERGKIVQDKNGKAYMVWSSEETGLVRVASSEAVVGFTPAALKEAMLDYEKRLVVV